MGAFCCHGKQTMRQITISFFLNPPIQETFLQNKGKIGSMALEELSSKSVNRRTDGQTDDGQKEITIAHPEHSSFELINGLYQAKKKKRPLSMLKMCRFTSSCTCIKSHLDICSPLIQSIVSNDSVYGHRRP